MQYFRWHTQLGLCPLVVCLLLAASPTRGQSAAPPDKCTADDKCTLIGNLWLRSTSENAAHEVCPKRGDHPCAHDAYDLIVKLGEISPEARCVPPYPRGTEALILRQEITEMILTASLQVDGFLAEIDSETAKIRAVHDGLTDRQNAAVAHSTLASAVATGGGAVGSALAIVRNTATAGNWVSATFGGAGTLFSFWGFYRLQRGPKGCFPDIGDPKQCSGHSKDPCGSTEEPSSACSPAMLHNLIYPKDRYFGFHSGYDDGIKAYLDDTPAGAQTSRGESLVLWWPKEDAGKKEKDCNRENEDNMNDANQEKCYHDKLDALQKKKALLAGNSTPRKLSIDDLTDRANKLADLRTVIARRNRDLSRLTEDLATQLQCTLPDAPNTQ